MKHAVTPLVGGKPARDMQPHHVAWLGAHPHRSEEWLRAHLKDGFDIHHLDGDHDNNDPLNLVLIDAADHMMVHNGSARFYRKPLKIRGRGGNGRRPPYMSHFGLTEEQIADLRSKSRLVSNG
jgi:hypothetical protein